MSADRLHPTDESAAPTTEETTMATDENRPDVNHPDENRADHRATQPIDPAPWDAPQTSETGEAAGTTGTAGAPASDAQPPGPAALPVPVSKEPRVGTVVWGLVIAAIGVGLLAAAFGAWFDVELALIALVALAGLGLVFGTVVTSIRRSRRNGT